MFVGENGLLLVDTRTGALAMRPRVGPGRGGVTWSRAVGPQEKLCLPNPPPRGKVAPGPATVTFLGAVFHSLGPPQLSPRLA